MMEENQLKTFVEQAISKSQWFESSDVQANYEAALDSYYGRNVVKLDNDGMSEARSQDVADMVESVVSQIMPAFDFAEIAVFDADNARDVDQARHESTVCNTYLRDRNHGYVTMQSAIRNALLLRNGILKVWPERAERVWSNRFENLLPIELLQATQPTGPDEEKRVLRATRLDNGRLNATVETTKRFKRLGIQSIDPTHFLVDEEHDEIDLQGAKVVGEHYTCTRSELLSRGHDPEIIEQLNNTTAQTHGAEIARNRSKGIPFKDDYGDPSLEEIDVFELYLLVDYDEDGIAERRRIEYAGGTSGGEILSNELYSYVPYASGTAFLQPQRWLGMSLYDKLKELECQKTRTLRAYMDNNDYANCSELLVLDGLANEIDLNSRRPGGRNRVDDMNAVKELTVSDNGMQSLALLNYLDKVRSERGGASLDLQAAELQLAGETAHGIERQYTSKEQLAQLMTRTLGETLVRQTFFLIHETLRQFFPERAEIRMGNQFVEMMPARWPHRDRITIIAGMSAADRLARKNALEMSLNMQIQATQTGFGGGVLTSMQNLHDNLIDWLAAGGISNPRRYWTDPRSPESVQAQQRKAAEAEQAARQQRAEQALAFRTAVHIEDEKNKTRLIENEAQLRFNYWKENLNATLTEVELEQEAEIESRKLTAQQAVGAQRASG